MKTLTKNNGEESLEKLSRLLDIPIGHGWKTGLAEWFGVDLPRISNWLKRGVSRNGRKTAETKGYPSELWVVEIENIHKIPHEKPKSGPGSTSSDKDIPKSRLLDISKDKNDKSLQKDKIDFQRCLYEKDCWVAEIALLMNDKDLALRLSKSLIYIRKTDRDKFDTILGMIFGTYDVLKYNELKKKNN